MPVPSTIADLSTTPGSNSPAGSESPALMDDYLRTAFAFIKQLDNTKLAAIADGSISTAKIVDDAVTFAKMQNIATARLVGRSSAGSGDAQELTGAQAQAILPIQQSRADIASAATVDLTAGSANNDNINITGATTITAFTVAAGRLLFVRFAGSLTLTNNASIVTQTGANIVTKAGDTCILRATAANVVEVVAYVPAVLNQQTTRSMVRVHSSNGYGSTNTVIRRFITVLANVGTDITYADSATLGGSFTINAPGVYAFSYVESFSAAGDFGISLNTTTPTTAIGSIAAIERVAEATTSAAATRASCGATMFLPAGSVLRPHTSGLGPGSTGNAQFTITRVA